MSKINDLDMAKWKELTDVWTDSLGLFRKEITRGLTTGIITVISFRKYPTNF